MRPYLIPLLIFPLITASVTAQTTSGVITTTDPGGLFLTPKIRVGPIGVNAAGVALESGIPYYFNLTEIINQFHYHTRSQAPTSTGLNATAIGSYAHAEGAHSIALGYGTWIRQGTGSDNDSVHSFAIGPYAVVSKADSSMALGRFSFVGKVVDSEGGNITSGYAFGTRAKATGSFSTAIGSYSDAKSAYSTVIGPYPNTTNSGSATEWVSTDPVFIIANGKVVTPDNPATVDVNETVIDRRNAMRVLKNGTVLIHENGGLSMGEFTSGTDPDGVVIPPPPPAQ
jgi:hypothetical protein